MVFKTQELLVMHMVLHFVDHERKPRVFSLEGQAVALEILKKLKAVVVADKFPEEAEIEFTKEEATRMYEFVKDFKVMVGDIEAKTSLLDKLK